MCKPCPMGFYEDRVGSTGCIPCPEYYRTNSTGAKSVNECFGKLHFRFPLDGLLNLNNAAGLVLLFCTLSRNLLFTRSFEELFYYQYT